MQKPPDNKPITIYDIAKEAGVSPSTVSRVLTNNTKVRKAKREKVECLIEKYHFKPNALAKGLSDAKSRVIGVIAADIRNPFYSELFVECESAAREAGYTVLLCNSLGQTEREIDHLEMLRQQRADAIIQIGGSVDEIVPNQQYVEKVNQITLSIPVVTTDRLDGAQCCCVQIDARKATELLMMHLFQLGHKRVALVGGRQGVTSTYEKYQTYLSMLKANHLEYREEYVIEGNYDYKGGYAGMDRLVKAALPPTAIIAINDFSAAGIMRCLFDHGYRIPEDISVVSYDNTESSGLLNPKLTSIDYDYASFGKKLVDTAIAVMENREAPILQKINPTLIIRESSAKAP